MQNISMEDYTDRQISGHYQHEKQYVKALKKSIMQM